MSSPRPDSVNQYWSSWVYRWLDDRGLAPLPAACVLCGAPTSVRVRLCVRCEIMLPRNARCCACCALPLPHALARCGRCLRRPPPFARTLAPLRYDYPVDSLMTRFKFHADLAAGDALCRVLAAALRRHSEPLDLLLPVPLHRERLAERGFNQAWEIARQLAREFGWPTRVDGLARIRATPAQSGLEAVARRYNVRDAFSLAIDVRGLRVAVVDDVVTTGATVRECAHVLRRAGALRVSVFALARAPLN